MTECDGGAPTGESAQSARFGRLRRRADFQRAARGRRARAEAFALQANRRATASDGLGARIGFTATKKLGGAVRRNRIRRRLKEALRLSENLETRPDHDYVVMAQPPALVRRFDLLLSDLERAFSALHAPSARSGRSRRPEDRDQRR
jgi:ribonuclease P protein component